MTGPALLGSASRHCTEEFPVARPPQGSDTVGLSSLGAAALKACLLCLCCVIQNQPAELFQDFTTLEYAVPSAKPIQPPAYVFVVDTCVAEDELRGCLASLAQALTTLPEYAQARARAGVDDVVACVRQGVDTAWLASSRGG